MRQLRRLTHPVPPVGSGALAIAIYAEASSAEAGTPNHLRAAQEQGLEGVACVDDAARAVVLYCRLWEKRRWPSDRVAALGLLRFLAAMQDPDGRFVNFIVDWTGTRNEGGITSYAGGPPWQARGVHALAYGVAVFGGDEWNERFERGLRWLEEDTPYLDVRAVCVLATLEHWRATGAPRSSERALAWAEEIADGRSGDCLLNAAEEWPVHLWGHLQEMALAEAGQALHRPDLVEHACASADALLLPAVEQRFRSEALLPFDVSCVVAGLAVVARVTGNPRYALAATRARAWFSGRNSAGAPVHDRRRGLVYDGIDDGRVSRNSGAESNIEGALALLGE